MFDHIRMAAPEEIAAMKPEVVPNTADSFIQSF